MFDVEVKLTAFPVVRALVSRLKKLPVVKDVDCRSKTPRVLAPLPMVVAVLFFRNKEATVLEVSVISNFPVGPVVPIPTLPESNANNAPPLIFKE